MSDYSNEKKYFNSSRKRSICLLVLNKTTKEIAETLKISEKTVRNHVSNTIQKLGVKGRAGALVELVKLGEIKI